MIITEESKEELKSWTKLSADQTSTITQETGGQSLQKCQTGMGTWFNGTLILEESSEQFKETVF